MVQTFAVFADKVSRRKNKNREILNGQGHICMAIDRTSVKIWVDKQLWDEICTSTNIPLYGIKSNYLNIKFLSPMECNILQN